MEGRIRPHGSGVCIPDKKLLNLLKLAAPRFPRIFGAPLHDFGTK